MRREKCLGEGGVRGRSERVGRERVRKWGLRCRNERVERVKRERK